MTESGIVNRYGVNVYSERSTYTRLPGSAYKKELGVIYEIL